MGKRFKILAKYFFFKTDIEKEVQLTEKILSEKVALTKDIKTLSAEAIRSGQSFDEVCIKLDAEIKELKVYLNAYKTFLDNGQHVFECKLCNQKIRIKDFENNARITCPKCKIRMFLSKNSFGDLWIKYDKQQDRDARQKSESGSRAQLRPYFEILGIANSSSYIEIKKAYREALKKYHPDKVSHFGVEFQQLAEIKTKEINEAFFKLSEYFC